MFGNVDTLQSMVSSLTLERASEVEEVFRLLHFRASEQRKER
jgi:hypothetical protein